MKKGKAWDAFRTGLALAMPVPLVPAFVTLQARRAWADPAIRADSLRQMDFLLGRTPRAGDATELAYRYTQYTFWRAELPWHPKLISQQRIEGLPTLTACQKDSRGTVISFMHHGPSDGLFPTLHTAGVRGKVMVHPGLFTSDLEVGLRRRLGMWTASGGAIPANMAGTRSAVEMLRGGQTIAISPDMPGSVPVTFLGRQVRAASGVARLAKLTDSPVVVVTEHRDAQEFFIRAHPPLDPRDFGDATMLLQAIITAHEPAVLAWPEAFETPLLRWNTEATEPTSGTTDDVMPGARPPETPPVLLGK